MFAGTVAPDADAVTVSGPETTPGPKTTCAAPSALAADPPVAVTFASAGGPRAGFEFVPWLVVVWLVVDELVVVLLPDGVWLLVVVDVLSLEPLPELPEPLVALVEVSEPPAAALFEVPAAGCVAAVPVEAVCVPVAASVALSTLAVSVAPALVSAVPVDVVEAAGVVVSKNWRCAGGSVGLTVAIVRFSATGCTRTGRSTGAVSGWAWTGATTASSCCTGAGAGCTVRTSSGAAPTRTNGSNWGAACPSVVAAGAAALSSPAAG